MTSAKDKRTAVAAALTTALGTGWNVHASPPENVVAPAAVVGPRSPYREWGTFGTEDVNLQITLFVPRALGAATLDTLDTALDTVLEALDAVPNAMVDGAATVGEAKSQSGVDYLAATIELTVKG
jgi:hypothetical protein